MTEKDVAGILGRWTTLFKSGWSYSHPGFDFQGVIRAVALHTQLFSPRVKITQEAPVCSSMAILTPCVFSQGVRIAFLLHGRAFFTPITKPHIWYVKMILVQNQVSRWHFQTPIMNNNDMTDPNIFIAIIWTHMTSTKPHMWYVKMVLVQNQVSRWHFQAPIMNNTGMEVPNISKALIWTHIASNKPHTQKG